MSPIVRSEPATASRPTWWPSPRVHAWRSGAGVLGSRVGFETTSPVPGRGVRVSRWVAGYIERSTGIVTWELRGIGIAKWRIATWASSGIVTGPSRVLGCGSLFLEERRQPSKLSKLFFGLLDSGLRLQISLNTFPAVAWWNAVVLRQPGQPKGARSADIAVPGHVARRCPVNGPKVHRNKQRLMDGVLAHAPSNGVLVGDW